MNTRHFSKKCGKCRASSVVLAEVDYEIQIDHDGRKYPLKIPKLSVPKCQTCGEISIDSTAEELIDKAFRYEAKLLTAAQIKKIRDDYALSQQQLADLLGVSPFTISRWETGSQIQQRSLDRMLRSFEAIPEFRDNLYHLAGISPQPMNQKIRIADTSNLILKQTSASQSRYVVEVS